MFTESLWEEWLGKEIENYKIVKGKRKYLKKGYTHFDHKFWLPDRKDELKQILQQRLCLYKPKLKRSEYWAFLPFLKILIKTPRYRYQKLEGHYELETKIRPISFACHIDSLIFGFYSFCLNKVYQKYIVDHKFDQCVLAYRSDLGKCNIQFAKEIFDGIKQIGECTCIALDIKGYFDNIDHITLLEKWQTIINGRLPEDQYRIFKALTQYSYVNKNSFVKCFKGVKKRNEPFIPTLLDLIEDNENIGKHNILRKSKLISTNRKVNKETNRLIGIPQGSALSALLSNIYLIDYDKEMYKKSINEGFVYRRYCDDIIIVCQTKNANELKEYAINKIAGSPYFLTIQNEKVDVIDFQKNTKGIVRGFKRESTNANLTSVINEQNQRSLYKSLQYLGFEFNGQKTLIRPSSLSRYFKKMKARITKTVIMAYGSNAKSDKIFLSQIFEKYSHLGQRNFISYAFNASKKQYKSGTKEFDGLDSLAIRKQLANHFKILTNTLVEKNDQRIKYKMNRDKRITEKKVL